MRKKQKERNILVRSSFASFTVSALLLVTDYLMIVSAELLAYWMRKDVLSDIGMDFYIEPIYIYIFIPVIFLFFLNTNKQSITGVPFWKTVRQSFWDVIYGVVFIAVLMYLGHLGQESISRIFLLGTGLFAIILVTSGRYFCRKFMNNYKIFQMPVIFIGAGLTAEMIIDYFKDDVGFGYRIIGFIDDAPVSKKIARRFRILGGFEQAEKIIRRTGVRHVFITAPGVSREKQIDLVNRIQPYVKSVSFVPDLQGYPGNLEIVSFADAGLMMIKVKNNLAHWHNKAMKRVFDIMCCLPGVILLSPVFAIISLMIYISDPGPIIFAHKRIGKNGKPFDCYKFRSMIADAENVLEQYLKDNPAAREEWEKDFKLKNDPRVTKIGAFLRKTSLDELPQLINVIKGEMSLVGPRPIVEAEIEKYGIFFKDFAMVTPGITGVWQVNGRSDTTYDERVSMDSWYVHNWSLWLDIWYLIKTFKVVLQRKGAY